MQVHTYILKNFCYQFLIMQQTYYLATLKPNKLYHIYHDLLVPQPISITDTTHLLSCQLRNPNKVQYLSGRFKRLRIETLKSAKCSLLCLFKTEIFLVKSQCAKVELYLKSQPDSTISQKIASDIQNTRERKKKDCSKKFKCNF